MEKDLGRYLSSMMVALTDRGPDSAGVAIYSDEMAGHFKITVVSKDEALLESLPTLLAQIVDGPESIRRRANHAVIDVVAAKVDLAQKLLRETPEIGIVSVGRRMELFKDVGRPEEVIRRYNIQDARGSHGVGHTRMATESAVTTEGSHPFSTGPDQCLVHNGSLSNHYAIRRTLEHNGLAFKTNNDSEVAAGYLTWRIAQGEALDTALMHALDDLDGFYTFVVATESGIGVLRDPIACKPAVMAETDRYVAFGTEYRALVDLPGIAGAHVWEPKPSTPYFWTR